MYCLYIFGPSILIIYKKKDFFDSMSKSRDVQLVYKNFIIMSETIKKSVAEPS